MKSISLFIFTIISLTINSQDEYHSNLTSRLAEDYNIENPEYVLFDNEAAIVNGFYVYGDASLAMNSVTDFDWSIEMNYDNRSLGNNPWDAGTGISNQTAINQNDIILVSFWAKHNTGTSLLSFFAEDSATFDKQFFVDLSVSQDWTQYFIVFKSTVGFNVGAMTFGLHLAAEIQTFDMAGFTVLNYKKQYPIEQFPSTFAAGNYAGNEADAAWRPLAEERIETLRKSDLNITVVDLAGNPVEDAIVTVEMQSHSFGFGSALVGCRFPGNDCYDQTYIDKVFDLDGKGHGFNVAVTENALKWDAWEEEWIGSPEETVSAIQYLNDNDVEVRGHTLVWTGFQYLPDDIQANQNSIDYVRSRLENRVSSMINHPVLSEIITEWDILNEITQNRDLENVFKKDPNFETGREIYSEIISNVKNLNPDQKTYINDYVVLSGGGSSRSVVDRYKSYLDEMAQASTPFDGIGFQCHIGSAPTSIIKIEETLNEFHERYNVPIKITEYDIEASVDEETQAKYIGDFLTMIFSHPAVEAFLMWGFWDGNHWKGNAPMFNLDWSLKPGGQMFIDKVFNEWWTNESRNSDASGIATFRPFKGTHKVTITKGNSTVEQFIDLSSNESIQIELDASTPTNDILISQFSFVPNPVINKEFSINFPHEFGTIQLEVFDISGQLIQTMTDIKSNSVQQLHHGSAGIYILKILSSEGVVSQKLIVN